MLVIPKNYKGKLFKAIGYNSAYKYRPNYFGISSRKPIEPDEVVLFLTDPRMVFKTLFGLYSLVLCKNQICYVFCCGENWSFDQLWKEMKCGND